MNPFLDKPKPVVDTRHQPCKTAAKPPRVNRSYSRISGMTVGDVRQCFSQMRSTPHLTSNTTLWCGMSAGHFALRYLINTAACSRKKRAPSDAS
jgi:hypothetical protein